MKDEPHARILRERLVLANTSPRVARGAAMVSHAEVLRWRTGVAACTAAPSTGPRTPEGLERSRKSGWKHGHYSAKAKRVRRDARQQYRLLPQLIAADNEDDVLDLISSL